MDRVYFESREATLKALDAAYIGKRGEDDGIAINFDEFVNVLKMYGFSIARA